MQKFNKFSLAILAICSVVILAGPNFVSAATSPLLVASDGYSILGSSTVTCTGSSAVTGDVGVSAGTSITGFPSPCTVSPGTTQANTQSAIDAQADNVVVFSAINQGCDHTYGDGQDLTALSPLTPGVYCSTGSFAISGNLNLSGSGVWIFKAASTLITATDSTVTGGDACNIWWRVGSSATLGTNSTLKGNVLALASVTLNSGATLDGRAFAQTGAVTLDANTVSGPTCAVPPAPPATTGTISVVKVVVGGSVTSFPLFVDGSSVVSGETNVYSAPATYTITETSSPNYNTTYSADCPNGVVSLSVSDVKLCTITNTYVAPASTGGGGGGNIYNPVVAPIIDVVKVPTPLALPSGPGPVEYAYTLRNIGTVPATDITMVGDTCSPIVFSSGDTNGDSILDITETWIYHCTTSLSETHTNTITATGWANGVSASDIASATVIVGVPVVPPLIHVTKVPNPLALYAGGGVVVYTEKITNPGTVALSNVSITDDKCSPMRYISGDVDGDSKLDTAETWLYTCQTNLTKTTTNTATVTGEANGFTATDFAIATVVVPAVPNLPNTGFPPIKGIQWGIAILAGILMLSWVIFVKVFKNRKA